MNILYKTRVKFLGITVVLTSLLIFPETAFTQIPELVLPDLTEGETMIYFDSLLQPVEKEKASFYMWTYFHLGQDVWSLKHKWRNGKYKLEWSGVGPGTPGSPVLLHGIAKWSTSNYSRLISEEQFADGRFAGRTILYDKKQQPIIIYDYEKKLDGQLWSLYVEKYKKNKVERAGYETYIVNAHHWETICTIGCYVSKDFRP